MGRSGYVDDYIDDAWDLIRWRGAVASAIRGRRGQGFPREMLAALDALPEPRLVSNALSTPDGEVCALGSVARTRGIPMEGLDREYPEDTDNDVLAEVFGIACAMVCEIEFVNDEQYLGPETPEERFVRVRRWVEQQLRESEEGGGGGE